MTSFQEREALAADIKAAIAELADGKVFPDLIAAIDRLAAQPVAAPVGLTDTKAEALTDEQVIEFARMCVVNHIHGIKLTVEQLFVFYSEDLADKKEEMEHGQKH